MDAWKCVATLRGDGQAPSESLPASLGKQGFTKLPMSSHQANWHWKIFMGCKHTILGNLMWGLVASLLRKHELWNALFPGTIGQPDTEAVPDFKCRKLCGHCCDVDVQNLAWWNSWPLFQKAHFKMSDKPDKSMRPDDHRRKWDHVEYEKNAQARLELEEAIEKSRERKDRSVRNIIWWILSYSLLDLSLFLGTFWMAVVKRCHCSIILCQGWARARERQTESAWVQGTGSSFN